MRALLISTLLLVMAGFSMAQESTRRVLTDEDYARAEHMMGRNARSLVYNDAVSPSWLDDGRFWYRNNTEAGSEFILVDPATGTKQPAFDHARIAEILSEGRDDPYTAADLPFSRIDFTDSGDLTFQIRSTFYTCNLTAGSCTTEELPPPSFNRTDVLSPDGKKSAFIRENNLWVKDIASGTETQLTYDGEEDFGYATNNAGWTRSDRPVLVWSPQSDKIATFQHDGRGVGEMYMATTNVGHPRLEAWKYPLPGDSLIFMIERVIIHLDAAPLVVRLQMPPDAHRSTICDHVACGGTWADVEWSDDGESLAFVSSSRDHKEAHLRVANVETGAVRDVMSEVVDTFFESGARNVNWTVLEKTNEVIWFSRRDNWSHLYLYDLTTGRLKRQITSGSWNVLQVLEVDEENRTILFMGNEREPGDPYYTYLYRVSIEDSSVRLLSPGLGNHSISRSPDGMYFVDVHSTPVKPAVSDLRKADGTLVARLETADISALIASGWHPPIEFKTKARDGETDLYGLMYVPADLDESNSYPVVNYLYPGPQSGSVGSRSFTPSRGEKQGMAELGFIVVEVDAMGTPLRSRSFHEAYYGNMGDNGLPDQITTIKQLAATRPWMDLDRVGIFGHSGGGFASTAGILRYPDFYKVAVSGAGNHDNRNYEDDWGEKWQGLLEVLEDGTTNYDNQANQLVAGNLKGKLLLAHGTMDTNVPMYNTLLVVDALIAANKDFDLLLFPNRGHGGWGNYMVRRRWDYFVQHLMGATPPKEYEFGRN